MNCYDSAKNYPKLYILHTRGGEGRVCLGNEMSIHFYAFGRTYIYAVGKSEARTGHLGKPFTTPQPNVLGGSIGSKPCRQEYGCKAFHVRLYWPPGVFGGWS